MHRHHVTDITLIESEASVHRELGVVGVQRAVLCLPVVVGEAGATAPGWGGGWVPTQAPPTPPCASLPLDRKPPSQFRKNSDPTPTE